MNALLPETTHRVTSALVALIAGAAIALAPSTDIFARGGGHSGSRSSGGHSSTHSGTGHSGSHSTGKATSSHSGSGSHLAKSTVRHSGASHSQSTQATSRTGGAAYCAIFSDRDA